MAIFPELKLRFVVHFVILLVVFLVLFLFTFTLVLYSLLSGLFTNLLIGRLRHILHCTFTDSIAVLRCLGHLLQVLILLFLGLFASKVIINIHIVEVIILCSEILLIGWPLIAHVCFLLYILVFFVYVFFVISAFSIKILLFIHI